MTLIVDSKALHDRPMRTTHDTLTGKPFRWNSTVRYAGMIVPARYTLRGSDWLHPRRVPAALLAELNPHEGA